MAAAAAVAFIAVLAGRPRDLATKTAERQSVALDDGSHVELNARTSLTVISAVTSGGEARVRRGMVQRDKDAVAAVCR